jgi:hypothetical protein
MKIFKLCSFSVIVKVLCRFFSLFYNVCKSFSSNELKHYCVLHNSTYFINILYFMQSTYFIPSQFHQTPAGKLYFKVVNTNNKRRKLGDDGPKKAGCKKIMATTDMTNMMDLHDGLLKYCRL